MGYGYGKGNWGTGNSGNSGNAGNSGTSGNRGTGESGTGDLYSPTFSKLLNVPGEGSGPTSAVDGYVLNITPWSAEVIDAAKVLVEDVTDRRRVIENMGMSPAGKKGPSGRMDYRISTQVWYVCVYTMYVFIYSYVILCILYVCVVCIIAWTIAYQHR
jgi:hypothetical protein